MAKLNGRTRKGVLDSIPLNGHGAEIGVFRGRFSSSILKERDPQKLYLIDPWLNFEDPSYKEAWYSSDSGNDMDQMYEHICKKFAHRIASGQVEVLRGKSSDVSDQIPDSSLDFVYIDGDHSYEGVKTDLEIAFRKTKETAIIALDDYNLGGWWKDGVVRAASEFIGAHADCLMILECIEKQLVLQRLPALVKAS